MPDQIDIATPILDAFRITIKNLPWQFWIAIIAALAVKMLPSHHRRRRKSKGNFSRTSGRDSLPFGNKKPLPGRRRDVSGRAEPCGQTACAGIDEEDSRKATGVMDPCGNAPGAGDTAPCYMTPRSQIKGWFGEKLLDSLLKVKLDSAKYRILHDIMLPTDDGATTQIDHIVVSEWGIFVIETKTYSGWVFGDAKSPQWTVSHFNRKYRFQNPLRQNYKHIATLAECLGIPGHYFRTIVAFSGESVFKTQMPPEVMHFGDVPGYIRGVSVNAIIKAAQVPEIVDVIREWQASLSRERKAAHVANLHRNHS